MKSGGECKSCRSFRFEKCPTRGFRTITTRTSACPEVMPRGCAPKVCPCEGTSSCTSTASPSLRRQWKYARDRRARLAIPSSVRWLWPRLAPSLRSRLSLPGRKVPSLRGVAYRCKPRSCAAEHKFLVQVNGAYSLARYMGQKEILDRVRNIRAAVFRRNPGPGRSVKDRENRRIARRPASGRDMWAKGATPNIPTGPA